MHYTLVYYWVSSWWANRIGLASLNQLLMFAFEKASANDVSCDDVTPAEHPVPPALSGCSAANCIAPLSLAPAIHRLYVLVLTNYHSRRHTCDRCTISGMSMVSNQQFP